MKTTLSILIVIFSMCHFAARAESNDAIDANAVRGACRLLLDRHLRQDVDERQLSRTWASQFMRTLDPRRMHFLASDADAFMKDAPRLIADAGEGRVDFAIRVARRFRARLDANSTLISDLLSATHDFSADESARLEHETYAATKADGEQRWRRRIKYELLLENADGPGDKNSREFLRGRYSRIREHFDSLGQGKILSLYIDSLARSFDPHSAYFDEDYLAMFRTGPVSNYTIGLPFACRRGDLWIRPTGRETVDDGHSFAGCRIVAVRVKGQAPIHLSGLTDGTALHTIISPSGELRNAKSVILDVDDPRCGKRMTVAVDRWPR